ARYLRGTHPAEGRQRTARDVVCGMRREPGVMDRLDAWVAVQERGDPQRVVRMGAHRVRQRADAAANEPAVERRRHGAARGLDRADALEDYVASPGHDGGAAHI